MKLRPILHRAKKLQRYGVWLLVAGTIALFGYYLVSHPNVMRDIKQLDPWLAILLLVLYGAMLLSLAGIYHATVRLTGHQLGRRENLLLTSYSTLINFFGPLQSGPGFRALYLKKRHNVSIRKYTVATIVYYLFYGFLSAVAIAVGAGIWWAAGLAVVAMLLILTLILPRYARRFKFNPRSVALLAGASAVQVALFGFIYYAELTNVDHHISIGQALTYAGTANLSLFAALTPGAIGIREAFLFFTQSLHHIPDATIIAASVIDRAIYIVFLGLLALGSLVAHTKDRLQVAALDDTKSADNSISTK